MKIIPTNRLILLSIPLFLAALPVFSQAQFYESTPVNISNSSFNETNPAVAWGSIYFGAVWFRGNDLIYAQVDENGAKVGNSFKIYTSPTGYWGKRLGFVYTGSNFVVAFARKVGNFTQIFLLRVHPSGDPLGTAVQVTSGQYHHSNPTLIWNGTVLGVAYFRTGSGLNDPHSVFFQRRQSNSGLSQVGGQVEVFTSLLYPDYLNLSWSGQFYALAWVLENEKIVFQRVKADGSLKGGLKTVFKTKSSSGPADLKMKSRDAKAYAIAFRWKKKQNSGTQVFFQRLKKTGVKKGKIFQISHSPAASGATEPAITWDGLEKHYGVFWSDARDNASPPSMSNNLYAAKLRKNGKSIVADYRLTYSGPQDRFPAVVNNGDVALLAFTRFPTLVSGQIFVTRMIIEGW